MKWIVRILILLIVVVGLFYALNGYIYNEKQGAETPALSNGEHLGFIHALIDNNTAMDFDDAIWLTGTAAEDAAIAAGICTEETRNECTPNGYFIQNSTRDDARISIDPQTVVVMQTKNMEETGGIEAKQISLTEFASLINDQNLHWNELPYTITITNNTVTRIAEVYIP